MSDLRQFLDRVKKERPSDLVTVEREVNPRHETTAILTKLEEKQRSPILVFERVKGSAFPLVTNVCGSMGRLALALDCPLKMVAERYAEGVENLQKPLFVQGPAPVHENIREGVEVDLTVLPQLVYHEADAPNPYITAAIVAARDPETKKINLSYHRMMISSRNTTGIFIERGKHLDGIYQKYRKLKSAMPIGVFIGSHPIWSLGALYSGSSMVEEYDVIGGLLRSPLSVVACRTQPDLMVPSHAEMVLEGFVPPEERMKEGPFGEFTGYGTGVVETPVFHVSAMYWRNGCLYQDVVSGHMEHLILPMPGIERRTIADAKKASSGVRRVSLVAPLTAIVALEKTDDAEPRRIIESLLRGDIYSKHVIVVDADVDISDLRQVLSKIALSTQASRDVYILPDEQGTPLDPSCTSPDGRVSKMGIDATRRLAESRRITPNTVPKSVLDSIDVAEFLKR
jgi:2,5-furandicarboxylate decarboxylase 1